MNKKGVIGLDTTKAVLVGVLILAVLTIALLLVLSNLKDTAEFAETKQTYKFVNETVATVDEVYTDLSYQWRRNCAISSVTARNASGGELIAAANYTVSGCRIKTNGATDPQNGTDWKISGIYSYNSQFANDLSGNVSTAPTNFFKQAPTVFTLLGIVLIILVIAIVIGAVAKFGMGVSTGGRGSTSSDEL